MPEESQDTAFNPGQDILKEFELANLSIDEKSTPEFGKKMAAKIWGYCMSGLGGYYWTRNARFQKNADYAYGRINIQRMFQDKFQLLNGKQNYIRLDWNTLQIVNRIISGLVGRWMQRNEKIVVQAIDDLSQKTKREEYEQIEFILENKAALEKLQQESGVRMIPQSDIPADKEELLLWKEQFQRLPEEIEQEMGCNDVLKSNGWYDTLKDMMLRDSAIKGLIGTKTWLDDQGVIHVEWMKPDNIIYSASDYDDFRDSTWRGYVPDMKISTLRRRYGKEFHPENPNALTEQQLWEIAQSAKEYKTITNIVWDNTWTMPFNLRPYDEWNVRFMEFEVRTVDKDKWTVTKTKTNTTYTQKGEPLTANGNKKQKPGNSQKIIEDTNENIYRGCYLPDNSMLLEWGLKKNMIRPQDPKEVGNAEFSYSIYMYQNYNGRNLAIPEKIQAAVDGMILALLKIQQIVARLVPSGWAIDETSLQNVDYGLGDKNNQVDQARMYFQTGLLYYRGIDAEGNRIQPPVQELANNGFVGQMQGLIGNYQFWYQTLKDELGEDPNMITAALQPRVTAQNVEASQASSNFATDYIYRAYAECMKITARKVSCLLQDSIKYGSQAYRYIVKQNVSDRIFSTDIKFLPTEQEVMRFEAMLQTAIASNPELTMFVNQFQAMQMAKEDYKLAWVYYNQCMKKMLLWKQQTAMQNQQATIQGQIQSAQAAEQAKQETENMKGQADIEKTRVQGEATNKNAVVALVTSLLAKGEEIPPYLMPLVAVTMENILIPLAVQNDQQKQALIQQFQQAQQQMMMPQQAPQMQEPQQEQIQQQQPQEAA